MQNDIHKDVHRGMLSTPLLTEREAAAQLQMSISTLQRLRRQRVIPFFKIGRVIRFHPADVQALLERKRVVSAESL